MLSPQFSTLIFLFSQQNVFFNIIKIQYFTNTNIKEKFLLYSALEINTKAVDVTEKKLEFFKCENFKWEISVVCVPRVHLQKVVFKHLFKILHLNFLLFTAGYTVKLLLRKLFQNLFTMFLKKLLRQQTS